MFTQVVISFYRYLDSARHDRYKLTYHYRNILSGYKACVYAIVNPEDLRISSGIISQC